MLRRVVAKDGRSRATVNDQPVSIGLLRRAGALLVEVQGQHDQMGLADPAGHAALLDAFAGNDALRRAAARPGAHGAARVGALETARTQIAEAAREEEWLRHAAEELATWRPEDGEEERLAPSASTCSKASAGPRRSPPPWPRSPPRTAAAPARPPPCAPPPARCSGWAASSPRRTRLAALDRAEEALAEAETLLTRLAEEADADPRLLERAEERLFALRAAARKHSIPWSNCPRCWPACGRGWRRWTAARRGRGVGSGGGAAARPTWQAARRSALPRGRRPGGWRRR